MYWDVGTTELLATHAQVCLSWQYKRSWPIKISGSVQLLAKLRVLAFRNQVFGEPSFWIGIRFFLVF